MRVRKEKEGEKEDGETREGSRMAEMPLARLAPSLHFLESRCSTHLSMSDMIICIVESTCSFPSSTVSSRLSQGTSLWVHAGFSRKKEAA